MIGADLNAPWDSPVADALASHGFVPATSGMATVTVGGRWVELDTLAARGLRLSDTPRKGGFVPGAPGWLPGPGEPSDHVPLVADITVEVPVPHARRQTTRDTEGNR